MLVRKNKSSRAIATAPLLYPTREAYGYGGQLYCVGLV